MQRRLRELFVGDSAIISNNLPQTNTISWDSRPKYGIGIGYFMKIRGISKESTCIFYSENIIFIHFYKSLKSSSLYFNLNKHF